MTFDGLSTPAATRDLARAERGSKTSHEPAMRCGVRRVTLPASSIETERSMSAQSIPGRGMTTRRRTEHAMRFGFMLFTRDLHAVGNVARLKPQGTEELRRLIGALVQLAIGEAFAACRHDERGLVGRPTPPCQQIDQLGREQDA